MASRLKRSVPVTVNDVLDGHVALDLECLDRLYLHGYLGQLQVGGQVIQFLNHRGYPVPSPACLQQIGDAFRRRVASFAQANHIPVVPLKAADRNKRQALGDYPRLVSLPPLGVFAAGGSIWRIANAFSCFTPQWPVSPARARAVIRTAARNRQREPREPRAARSPRR
jgi:hypothetical protein